MPVAVAVGISPAKLRDGDPCALAALCDLRGAAVLAYCEQVAAHGHATRAAADAFAQLRASVVAPRGVSDMQGDALLRHIVRRAAARRGSNAMAARDGNPVSESCDAQELELVAYVEGSLSRADRGDVDEHLTQCGACTAAHRRLEAAERAYERPPRAPLPGGVVEELLRALLVVAPVRACGGNVAAVQEEAMRQLTRERACAAAPAPLPRVRVPSADRPAPRCAEAAPRPRPAAHWRAASALPPAGSAAPPRRLPAVSRLRMPTLGARAFTGRGRGRPSPVSPAVLLAAAAVLGTAATFWLSSSPQTSVSPTPSAPVVIGGPGGASSGETAATTSTRSEQAAP